MPIPNSLLAEIEFFRSFAEYTGRSFRLEQDWYYLVAFAAIIVFWVVMFQWDKRRSPVQGPVRYSSASTVFLELCEAHELSKQEKRLLASAVTSQQVSSPGILFVDPSHLQALAVANHADAPRFADLLRKLFDMAVPESAPEEPSEE